MLLISQYRLDLEQNWLYSHSFSYHHIYFRAIEAMIYDQQLVRVLQL